MYCINESRPAAAVMALEVQSIELVAILLLLADLLLSLHSSYPLNQVAAEEKREQRLTILLPEQ